MNAVEVLRKQKLIQRHMVNADSNGDVPTRIEILKAGSWPASSVKGPLEITVGDLYEMKSNFDRGIGVPGGKEAGLPIDFMHNDWDKAAAWIKDLEVEGSTLFAVVEWSKSGEEAIRNKEFKCVSPSFYPACLGQWTDPENADITARNVLVGAGLTNIPFFKDLKQIMASRNSESDSVEENVIFINASEKENRMTLEEVRGKDLDSLTEDEKNFLSDNKDSLNADERTKFGFEVEQVADPVVAATQITADQKAKIEADVRAKIEAENKAKGLVTVEATALESLKASQTKFETKEAETIVNAHIGRGALKADQKDAVVKQLVEADKTQREFLENMLTNLPDHPMAQKPKGEDEGAEVSATAAIMQKAQAKVDAAAKLGQTLSKTDAIDKVMKEDTELAQAYAKETGGTN